METSRKKIDMLTGSLWDKIFMFALPLAATGILQQLFNAADVAVVGRFAGAAAMAAVGSNSSIVGLIVNLFVGMALGTNVVIARAIGMRDRNTIEKAVHSSVLFAVAGGACAAVLGEIFVAPILTLINVPEEVMPMAALYLRIYLAGLPIMLLYNYESAIFRAVGDTKTPLVVLAVSGVINVALNLFFVIVLKMTVDGVALATLISNLISASLLFRKLTRSELDIRLTIKKLRIDKRVFAHIMKIGVPAGVQSAVFSFANIIIQSAINSLGTVIMAASSAAFNIEVFAYQVMNSFSQACTTFVGQNNGAGKLARCKKTLGLCMAEGAVCLGISVLIILTFGKQILSIFNTDAAVIENGYTRLMIMFSAYTFSMFYENIGGYLRGFGISLAPAILTILGVCGVRIFWVYAVFPSNRSFNTIMTAYPISLALTAFLMLIAMLFIRPARAKARERNISS